MAENSLRSSSLQHDLGLGEPSIPAYSPVDNFADIPDFMHSGHPGCQPTRDNLVVDQGK